MSELLLGPGLFPNALLRPTVEFIQRSQLSDGCIPWFSGGHADPWDHVEAAMGLTIGGEYDAAAAAYRWLKNVQLPDGSWWASYQDGVAATDGHRETNFVAYIATGLWHFYLITRDRAFLLEMWSCLEGAIDFVLAQQGRYGDINWAVDHCGQPLDDALRTGCCSIFKSLECASNIAVTLGEHRPAWRAARTQLGRALREHPERFDRTWDSKARYSMDWFYPVLTGVIPGAKGLAHLQARWREFVEPGLGCRCVADQPWVTVAESSELCLALLAAGDHARAVQVFSWLDQWRGQGGEYWTGYQLAEDLLWPDQRPTWTAAAVLLAADALTEYSPACRLFTSTNLLDDSAICASSRPSESQFL